MLEQYAFLVLVLGLVIGAVGCLWLLIAAFKVSKAWGFGTLLFPPLALVFIPCHWRRSVAPVLVLLLSGLLLGAPYAVNYYNEQFGKLGPREKTVGEELHITLTGVTAPDYAGLQSKPRTVVLQMANPDVTDATLAYLKGMDELRELDLTGTQVTDEGLPTLAGLPKLQELRLRRTKITDEGFRKYLAPKESLLKVDVQETEVKSKTLREWKKEKPEQRDYLK
jgi:hypothetical protein